MESEVHVSEPRHFDCWNLYWNCVFSFSTKHIESSLFLNVILLLKWSAKTVISAELLYNSSSKQGTLHCSELLRSVSINTYSPRALKPKQVISV